jgi:ABC-type glycerol-3-phosphate transport system substrate-binding protein
MAIRSFKIKQAALLLILALGLTACGTSEATEPAAETPQATVEAPADCSARMNAAGSK